MRINGYRCDGCGKEHLLEAESVQGFYAIPDDWFLVTQGKIDRAKEPLLFCSKGCLREWVSAQLTADDISLR